jgi:hypothetical protein
MHRRSRPRRPKRPKIDPRITGARRLALLKPVACDAFIMPASLPVAEEVGAEEVSEAEAVVEVAVNVGDEVARDVVVLGSMER